jgi:hypothetical protein
MHVPTALTWFLQQIVLDRVDAAPLEGRAGNMETIAADCGNVFRSVDVCGTGSLAR